MMVVARLIAVLLHVLRGRCHSLQCIQCVFVLVLQFTHPNCLLSVFWFSSHFLFNDVQKFVLSNGLLIAVTVLLIVVQLQVPQLIIRRPFNFGLMTIDYLVLNSTCFDNIAHLKHQH